MPDLYRVKGGSVNTVVPGGAAYLKWTVYSYQSTGIRLTRAHMQNWKAGLFRELVILISLVI